MKVFILILLLASTALAYDPMDRIQPENASDQVVDSFVLGLNNASPYMMAITFLGFFAAAFAAMAFIAYLLNQNQGGTK